MPQLDYAPKPAWHSRWQRYVLITVTALVFGLLTFRYAPVEWRNVRLYYWQQRCLSYVPPMHDPWNNNPFEKFYSIYSPPGGVNGCVFVHGMRSHNGKGRLVAVEPFPEFVGNRLDETNRIPSIFLARSFELGSPLSPPVEIVSNNWSVGDRFAGAVSPGQIDPADSSHFTIQCGTDILDGWLRDDGSVLMEARRSKSAQ